MVKNKLVLPNVKFYAFLSEPSYFCQCDCLRNVECGMVSKLPGDGVSPRGCFFNLSGMTAIYFLGPAIILSVADFGAEWQCLCKMDSGRLWCLSAYRPYCGWYFNCNAGFITLYVILHSLSYLSDAAYSVGRAKCTYCGNISWCTSDRFQVFTSRIIEASLFRTVFSRTVFCCSRKAALSQFGMMWGHKNGGRSRPFLKPKTKFFLSIFLRLWQRC